MSNIKHKNCIGGVLTEEYKAWKSMRSRCSILNKQNLDWYGIGGISICPQWMDSFETFLKDMGKKPSPKHSLERIDNDGNYEPGNCVWATPKEQANNRRSNRLLTFNGVTKTMAQWSEEAGVGIKIIWQRIQRGSSVKDALTKGDLRKGGE